MCIQKNWRTIFCLVLLVPFVAMAQTTTEPLQTDWLELVKGYRGSSVGAQLQEVEEGEQPGTQKITLSIPKAAMGNPDGIEEVVVVGRRPEKPEPILDVSYEWVDDYDNDNYGLIIRLSKDTKWPIRLYMYSEPGYIR